MSTEPKVFFSKEELSNLYKANRNFYTVMGLNGVSNRLTVIANKYIIEFDDTSVPHLECTVNTVYEKFGTEWVPRLCSNRHNGRNCLYFYDPLDSVSEVFKIQERDFASFENFVQGIIDRKEQILGMGMCPEIINLYFPGFIGSMVKNSRK